MDNVTHSLIGVAMSRVGLNRLTPHATWLLVIASNIPDADVVTALGGSLAYLDAHRGPTHGLPVAPFLAVLPVLIVKLIARKTPIPFAKAWIVSLIGILCHYLMDFVTSYGIRLLSPISDRWFQLPLLFIVDPYVLIMLLLSLAGPALSKLVAGEIGAAGRSSPGRGWAIFALLFIVMWTGGRWVARERALAMLDARIYHGAAPKRITALPEIANPLRWRGLVEGDGFVSAHDVHLAFDHDPDQGLTLWQPEKNATWQAARRTDTFQRFLRFAQWPSFRIIPMDEPPGAQRVTVDDIRFGYPSSTFHAEAEIDANQQVLSERFTMGRANQAGR